MPSGPLVSIVTPFYNAQEFLEECVESVLRQSYQHWEYVLVDNFSTDGSSEIAARYASRFPEKIRLVHTGSFLPQVQNYNFALTCIAPDSKYCKMVQADDWIFPECISRMVEVAEIHPAVGIVAAYELEGNEVRLSGLPYPSPEVSGRNACRFYFLNNYYFFGTPTSVLMRSELVRSRRPFYDEKFAPFEDGHACFELLKAWNFGFVHQVLTYTRRNNDSIISRLRPFGLEQFLRFSLLVSHGRDCLNENEYGAKFRQLKREYFSFLCSCAVARRRWPKEFWEFHRKGLAAIGYRLNWMPVARWLPRTLLTKAWDTFWNFLDGGRNGSRERDGSGVNNAVDRYQA